MKIEKNPQYIYIYACASIWVIYMYIEMIDCGESNSMIEICEKLDKSNT